MARLFLRRTAPRWVPALCSRSILKEFPTRSAGFRLRWRVRSFGPSGALLSGECSRVALQFNIEEIVRKEIEDRSPREVGSVSLPRKLRTDLSDSAVFQLKPTASRM